MYRVIATEKRESLAHLRRYKTVFLLCRGLQCLSMGLFANFADIRPFILADFSSGFYSYVLLEIHFPKEQQAFAPRKIQSSLSLINS